MQIERDVPASALRTRNLADFQKAVNSSFVPLRVDARGDRRFTAGLTAVGTGGVMFSEVTASSSQVERTDETIALGGSGYYKLSLLLEGSSLLVQDGREAVMGPGDLLFYDTSRPYSLDFAGEFRNLVLMFPKDRLPIPGALADTLTAVPLWPQHPLVGVIAPFIAQASPHLATLPIPECERLANATLDLVAVMLTAILDAGRGGPDPRPALLQRVQEHILRNLASPDLTPGRIAAAQYLSVRRLHSLFHESGTTVGAWIRAQRLARCREDLLAPAHAHRGVAEIGAGWGFADPAHFSRSFRAAYGLSPSELRRARGVR